MLKKSMHGMMKKKKTIKKHNPLTPSGLTARRLRFCAIAMLLLCLASCNGIPSYVVGPKKMSEVLADMHTAEAVIDMRHNQYPNDSTKLALKQSVFEANGITQRDFDTSLVWYAHHMDKYIDLYQRTIEILEKRSAQAGSLAMAVSMSMAGDSVNVWGASPFILLTDKLPSRMVTFDISADENWEPGDSYVWRIKLIDGEGSNVNWNITANYTDSIVEFISLNTTMQGWNEITFISDSTKQMQRLRGAFEATNDNKPMLWVDSIQLLRKRLNPQTYRLRHRQRAYPDLTTY